MIQAPVMSTPDSAVLTTSVAAAATESCEMNRLIGSQAEEQLACPAIEPFDTIFDRHNYGY